MRYLLFSFAAFKILSLTFDNLMMMCPGVTLFKVNLFEVLFPGGSDSKASCLQCGRPGFDPWVGKILWRRKWQPTPVLLPGKSHGQRSMVGYSSPGRKESDMTERLQFQFQFGPHGSRCPSANGWIKELWYT